jgi:hypothetical protein
MIPIPGCLANLSAARTKLSVLLLDPLFPEAADSCYKTSS